MHDISERRRLEREAWHLAALVDSSDDAIVSKTLNGTVVSWNRAAERLFGYTAAEIIGRSIRLIIPDDRQEEEDYVLARVRRGEGVDHFETVRVRKDGTHVPISLTVSPIRSATGEIVGASKIARDLSRVQHAQRDALRLAAIVDSSDDAIVSKDLNGIVSSWNSGGRSHLRLFGGRDGRPVDSPPHSRRSATGGGRGPRPHQARRPRRPLRDRSPPKGRHSDSRLADRLADSERMTAR